MPELPEVETIKNVIEPQIKGLRIEKVIVNRPEVIAHPSEAEFCVSVAGQVISGMKRRGKFLMILLESGDWIILHLRMTGGLLVTSHDAAEEKYTHLVFALSNRKELRFSDMRRFGRFWLIRNGETDNVSGVSQLGIEPFDDALTAEYLKNCFGNSKRAVKQCLLDQSVVAGIGNIYSDEILFAAGISPDRQASCLRKKEWNRLAELIPERLFYFIEKNQITPEEYLETKGKDYRNTPFLQVYGHAGEPCPVCGKTLCRKVIGGRSSVSCPGCQKE